MEFKPGDKVKLKSGGVSMVIDEVFEDSAEASCTWMDGASPKSACFKLIILEHDTTPTGSVKIL